MADILKSSIQNGALMLKRQYKGCAGIGSIDQAAQK
jgi:hypothetical protein